MSKTALILAFTAIGFWSFLALLVARVSHLPPLFVVGSALTFSGLFSIFAIKSWKVPLVTLVVGIAGIFGYHFLYVAAFSIAPPVETNLLNYLWPLLIVLLSPVILKGYKLKPHHILGTILGFLGAWMIISGGSINLDRQYIAGYLLAIGAAFVWACYSLMTKKLPPFPTRAVGLFCLISGVSSLLIFYLFFNSNVLAEIHPGDWISLVLLGIGPMGAAFFAWDAALKRGDPRIIGALAYLTPLLSTLVLVFIGGYKLSNLTLAAMILIIAGALVGSKQLFSLKNISQNADSQLMEE